MNIKLIVVGKTSFEYLHLGEKEYLKRIKKYAKFETETIPNIKNSNKISEPEIKTSEAYKILKKIKNNEIVILLDEKGNEFSSVQFSKQLQKWQNGGKNLTFVIGGAYGFSDEIYKRADNKLALSKMTFPHQLIRLIFLEQLYRAFTIQKGEPYHHE